jgi:hypothetical protein
MASLDVTLLYFDTCPNWLIMKRNLQELSSEFSEMNVTLRMVDSPAEAEQLAFHGSPSIQVNGVDPFADSSAPVGLSCRVYATPDGLAGAPTKGQLSAALHGVANEHS